MRQTVLVLAALLSLAGPATAQDRGHVRALGGATFGADPAPFFGGSAGYRVYEGLSFTVELGRMQDVLPRDRQDDLDLAFELIELISPVEIDVDVDMRAFYGLAGLRFDVRDERVRPYVDGGVGFASLTTDIEGSIGGFDIPDILERELRTSDETTKFMSSIGGGVALDLSDHAGLDIGYRYERIWLDDDPIDVHKVYGALRFGF
jgi:opacity protein-like surface antigen